MFNLNEISLFIFTAFLMVISPGPNMVYLVSRSITQGKKAGFISLCGVISGFIFHILATAFGLTALFMAVPIAYTILKTIGACYLLYLAWLAISSESTIFSPKALAQDSPSKLFRMGFLTNVLNPKAAIFYMSFLPQFIHPEKGNIFGQSVTLGLIQMSVSFTINFLIVMTAATVATWFSARPLWVNLQKWVMATVLSALAVRMLIDKSK